VQIVGGVLLLVKPLLCRWQLTWLGAGDREYYLVSTLLLIIQRLPQLAVVVTILWFFFLFIYRYRQKLLGNCLCRRLLKVRETQRFSDQNV